MVAASGGVGWTNHISGNEYVHKTFYCFFVFDISEKLLCVLRVPVVLKPFSAEDGSLCIFDTFSLKTTNYFLNFNKLRAPSHLLPNLQYITIVIVNREFPHPVVETFQGISHFYFIFQPFP